MDPRIIQSYNDQAHVLAASYAAAASAPARHFPVAFTAGSRILDVGCGSGRDLDALTRAGYLAAGVDGSPAMLAEARDRYFTKDKEAKPAQSVPNHLRRTDAETK